MGQATAAQSRATPAGNSVLITTVCAFAAIVGGIQVPVVNNGGFAHIELRVGTPPQRVLVQVDTASPYLWVPEATDDDADSHRDHHRHHEHQDTKGASSKPSKHKHHRQNYGGFDLKDSTSAKVGEHTSFSYLDGLHVQGAILADTVRLGKSSSEIRVTAAPLLVAQNMSDYSVSEKPAGQISGKLGLECHSTEEIPSEGAGFWGFLAGSTPLGQGPAAAAGLQSFFVDFWKEHPEVPKTFLLSFGAPTPHMAIGEDFREGSRVRGGVRFLAQTFTRRSDQWYTSMRAIGLSMGRRLFWNFDFNQLSSTGAPALFDSGFDGIRLGHVLFEHVLSTLLDGGCEVTQTQTIICPCDPSNIEATFPSLSLSFEAAKNMRILGLDAGADVRVCIPPGNYVFPSKLQGRCDVLIHDGGREHKSFGLEAVVLGMPLFRSVTVVLDRGTQMLGVGAAAMDTAGSYGYNPVPASTEADGGEGGASYASSYEASEICECADPKNWWQTGHRFSPWRVVVVLAAVALVMAYVHIGFSPSPSAENLRNSLGALMGGPTPPQPESAAQNQPRRPGPDRPFMQMAGAGSE